MGDNSCTPANSLIFITGGARSGKSSYAQNEALQLSGHPVYVATAKVYPNDAEFEQRIQRHKDDRDERWTSIEEQFMSATRILPIKWLSLIMLLYGLPISFHYINTMWHNRQGNQGRNR